MSDYSEEDGAELDAKLARADRARPDLTDAPLAARIKALQSLVALVESGLRIVSATHYDKPPAPEPYPGACQTVVRQSMEAIRLARCSGLIP